MPRLRSAPPASSARTSGPAAIRLAVPLAAALSLAGAGAAWLCLSAPAAAQGLTGGAGPGGNSADADADHEAAEARANAPPPALPGAVPTIAGSARHAPADMDPNTALFDAIDRDDVTEAKDALSRGADLNATNVLGQKPIDMSIDLNHNDITFLLLSMRDTAGGSESAGQTASVSSNGAGSLTVNASSTRRKLGVQEARATRDSDGGTPKPEIGFLGFNGS